jgi:hypothetical protein
MTTLHADSPTLQDLIIARRVRKGPASGTTKRGAYWLACDRIEVATYGGDGIGQSAARTTVYLLLRHYRDGAVRAIARVHNWHQNYVQDDWYSIPSLPACRSIEEVIVALLGRSTEETGRLYTPDAESGLIAALSNLGLREALPAPDGE